MTPPQVVGDLGRVMEDCVKENNALDVYEEHFGLPSTSMASPSTSEPPSARTLRMFRDPSGQGRTATSVSWSTDGTGRIAIAHCVRQFQHLPDNQSTFSYVWNVNNPTAPEMELHPASALCTLEYSPKDPHVLVGGCYNGQLAYWDRRKGPAPIDVTPVNRSHTDPVYRALWIQSKTGLDCFSVSTDGQVMWWDVRSLAKGPTEQMQLVEKKSGMRLSGVAIDYEPTLPTRFMVGTEQGIVLSCNRKGKLDKVERVFRGHHGPVYSVQRSPFFPKYFLSVGDWTSRVWQEDLPRSPIMMSMFHSAYLTDGAWSPTRPGVFLTSKIDGTLDVWDHLFKQNDPVLQLRVSDAALQCMRLDDKGKLLACGARDGTVTLLELCDGLSVIQANEKTQMAQMLDREYKREKVLEQRSKEQRAAEKKKLEVVQSRAGLLEPTETATADAEEAFWRAVGK